MLFSAVPASAAEKSQRGEVILLDTYHRNLASLEKNSFGLPLFLKSFERDNRVHVDVYGIFAYPFSSVVDVLKVPANWCDIVSLHLNVKACTYRETAGQLAADLLHRPQRLSTAGRHTSGQVSSIE